MIYRAWLQKMIDDEREMIRTLVKGHALMVTETERVKGCLPSHVESLERRTEWYASLIETRKVRLQELEAEMEKSMLMSLSSQVYTHVRDYVRNWRKKSS